MNGILNVSAKDKGTGKEIAHRIEKTGGLSKEEIEKMKQDAEAHAAEDKKRREVIDLKNQGESLAYSTEKLLKDNGDKVPADTRGQIESALNQLREALKGDDGASIKKSMDNLNTISHKLAEEMYKAGGAPGGPQGGPAPEAQSDRGTTAAGGKKDDDVIDAEYEVKE